MQGYESKNHKNFNVVSCMLASACYSADGGCGLTRALAQSLVTGETFTYFLASCMTKMGDPGTSAWTWLKREGNSSEFRAFLMPLPPPPSDALIITG